MEGTFSASSRYLRISPRKLRLVAALVRGKSLAEALVLIRFVPQKAGRFMEGALRSALGNAKDRSKGSVEGLVVQQVRVDEGPQPRDTKRWTPKAMGRVGSMRRRTSHLLVVVGGGDVSKEVKKQEIKGTKKAKSLPGSGGAGKGIKAAKKQAGKKINKTKPRGGSGGAGKSSKEKGKS